MIVQIFGSVFFEFIVKIQTDVAKDFTNLWCVVLSAALNSTGYKRPEQPWIWSNNINNNINSHANLISTPTTTAPATTTEHPCNYNPVKPDFRLPGRRISEAMCQEYIWERYNRADKRQKSLECFMKSNGHEQFPTYVIGGKITLPGEYPHMGALGWRVINGTWIFKCGSALISSKYALTAAHCSKSPRDPNLKSQYPEIIRLGDKNIVESHYHTVLYNEQAINANIVRIIVHPRYSAPKKYFDIALVELAEEQKFTSFVQPACLWSDFNTDSLGATATVTGWGVVETANRRISPELQAAVVNIIDSQLCDNLLRPSCNRHWCGIEDHQICAGKLEGGVDACQGDSGGPLQVEMHLPSYPIPSHDYYDTEGKMHYVLGVTSFGIKCARPNTPGVYTRVSSFVDWIESIVWPGN